MNAVINPLPALREPPSVGVAFTTYNRPHDLARVLAGYARQTYGKFEIVIADDGSTLIGLRIPRIDALKIDIEGAEDQALCPFLCHAPLTLLPRRIVLEDSDALWKRDLRAALTERGYSLLFRTRLNSVYESRADPFC